MSAKGRFVVRVDADDYVNREFLKTLFLFLTENSYMDAVSCDYFVVSDKEKVIRREDSSKKPIGCGIMFQTEQLVTLGMYDKSFHVHEDKDLRHRFLKKYKIKSNEPSANFFLMNFDEVKINSDKAFEELANKRLILRKMTQYNMPSALRITIGNEEANEQFINSLGSVFK